MAKIKIDDLSRLEDLSPEEAKGIFGGAAPLLHPQTGHLGPADPAPAIDDYMPKPADKSKADSKSELSDKKKGNKRP